MRTTLAILAAIVLEASTGCENVDTKSSLQKQIQSLTEEKEQLRDQVKTLSGLTSEIRLENLYDLQQVKIGKYTNLFDKDEDGKKEKLIVYLEPIDEDGDIIKAAGIVDVQLWDLNRKEEDALLGQWQVGPKELKELWFVVILSINYRLTFDVADLIDTFKEPLTVKVTFTDYVTGKVFKEQKVIKP
jgi:hypothetical protein